MKTKKYLMEVEFCENIMVKEMEISKREFDKQMKFMRNQTIVTAEYECPVIEPEWSCKIFEHTNYTETCYTFQSGCCATYLTKLETKVGYSFKNKGAERNRS